MENKIKKRNGSFTQCKNSLLRIITKYDNIKTINFEILEKDENNIKVNIKINDEKKKIKIPLKKEKRQNNNSLNNLKQNKYRTKEFIDTDDDINDSISVKMDDLTKPSFSDFKDISLNKTLQENYYNNNTPNIGSAKTDCDKDNNPKSLDSLNTDFKKTSKNKKSVHDNTTEKIKINNFDIKKYKRFMLLTYILKNKKLIKNKIKKPINIENYVHDNNTHKSGSPEPDCLNDEYQPINDFDWKDPYYTDYPEAFTCEDCYHTNMLLEKKDEECSFYRKEAMKHIKKINELLQDNGKLKDDNIKIMQEIIELKTHMKNSTAENILGGLKKSKTMFENLVILSYNNNNDILGFINSLSTMNPKKVSLFINNNINTYMNKIHLNQKNINIIHSQYEKFFDEDILKNSVK